MRSIAEIFRSYAEFDAQGKHINGTDKQSNHNYGAAYEQIVVNNFSRGPAEPRNVVQLMMEVGVADGSCLLAWREIFPNATIVGMDIHYSDKAHGERIEFHMGSQMCAEHCAHAAAGRKFDMIVEDATHRLDGNLLTLFYLWPNVKKGGIYVIEEFNNVSAFWPNIMELFPFAEIVSTIGPFGGVEPLVVLRKPSCSQ